MSQPPKPLTESTQHPELPAGARCVECGAVLSRNQTSINGFRILTWFECYGPECSRYGLMSRAYAQEPTQ
jgi:hypothetical protein